MDFPEKKDRKSIFVKLLLCSSRTKSMFPLMLNFAPEIKKPGAFLKCNPPKAPIGKLFGKDCNLVPRQAISDVLEVTLRDLEPSSERFFVAKRYYLELSI